MKPVIFLFCLLFALQTQAQLTTPPNGGNKKAMVSEQVGITDVTITYNRPGVKGREGKIWGSLVHYGFADLGFGTSKAAPWRAGANENTTIEFSTPVTVEGQPLPAGKYGFFIAVQPDECTLIFSKNASSWGSYFYNEHEDALRVKVKPVSLDKSVEWLEYRFEDETPSSATIALYWEKKKIPFTVAVDLPKLQLESFRRELRSDKGFTWQAWNEAANYCLTNNTNLEEGLEWANQSIEAPFVGEANFVTLSTKAGLLNKLGRTAEADSTMHKAFPLGNMQQLHNYARNLLQQHQDKQAFDVFKKNYDKNPNVFTTNMGMARGYSALGNYKEALNYARKALAQAPDQNNKTNLEKLVAQLQEGKNIN
jgi:tetratricopeptide (TPR) repeat protein